MLLALAAAMAGATTVQASVNAARAAGTRSGGRRLRRGALAQVALVPSEVTVQKRSSHESDHWQEVAPLLLLEVLHGAYLRAFLVYICVCVC